MLHKSYVVPFIEGFHARPASQFIQLVKDFSGDVQIELKKEAASLFTKLDEFF